MENIKTDEIQTTVDGEPSSILEIEDSKYHLKGSISILNSRLEGYKKEITRLLNLDEIQLKPLKKLKMLIPQGMPLVIALALIFGGIIRGVAGLIILGIGGAYYKLSIDIASNEYPKITPDGSEKYLKALKELLKSRHDIKCELSKVCTKADNIEAQIDSNNRKIDNLELRRQELLANKQDGKDTELFPEVVAQYSKEQPPRVYGLRMQTGNKD